MPKKTKRKHTTDDIDENEESASQRKRSKANKDDILNDPLLDKSNILKFRDNKIICEVCGDEIDECPEDDRPIQCTKCHMWVHEGCFLLGETCKNISKFVCHICSSGLRKIPKCCVCPINSLHAMVPNKDKTKWCHITCVQWVDGLSFDSSKTFTGYDLIEKTRFKLVCIFCNIKYGAPIQCDERKCYNSYHPLCCRKRGLKMTYDEAKGCLLSYCQLHSPQIIVDIGCEICGRTDDDENMLLCDECDKGYHLQCMNMKREDIPEGNWYCNECIEKKKLFGEIVVIPTVTSSAIQNNKEDNDGDDENDDDEDNIVLNKKSKRKSKRNKKNEKPNKEYSHPPIPPETQVIYKEMNSDYISSLPLPPSLISDSEDDNDNDYNAIDEEEIGVSFFDMKKKRRSKKSKEDEENEIQLPTLLEIFKSLPKYPMKHLPQIKQLLSYYINNKYDMWIRQMRIGFNILTYGFGSKLMLLNHFGRMKLLNENVMVIEGFKSQISIKEIINSIIKKSLKSDQAFTSPLAACQYIKQQYSNPHVQPLYLIIHNIDGHLFRMKNYMYLFSIIASAPYLHIIASIDHVNSSLLWDQITLHNFNWMHYDCTNYLPYTTEIAANISSNKNDQNLKESGITYILQSLTRNHKVLLQYLAQFQLENKKAKGLTFDDLYHHCISDMIVNSNRALKNMLKELKDHELISQKISNDGREYIKLTVSERMLNQLAENSF